MGVHFKTTALLDENVWRDVSEWNWIMWGICYSGQKESLSFDITEASGTFIWLLWLYKTVLYTHEGFVGRISNS